MFGKFRQLEGHYCSYLLPYCPGKMAEPRQQEVFADEMGHTVFNEEIESLSVSRLPSRMCGKIYYILLSVAILTYILDIKI